LPCPARREHGRAREDRDDRSSATSSTYAPAQTSGPPNLESVMRSMAVCSSRMRTRGLALERVEQRALHLAPRHVPCVRDAARAVPPFEVKVEVGSFSPLPGARSKRAPTARASLDALGPLLHADLDGALVAKPGAGDERVLDVRLERVPRASTAAMPALRVLGVRLVARPLRHEDDVAVAEASSAKVSPRRRSR
jgi:hypothetical protein